MYELSKEIEDIKSVVLEDDEYDILDFKKFKLSDKEKQPEIQEETEEEEDTAYETEESDDEEKIIEYKCNINVLDVLEKSSQIFLLLSVSVMGLAFAYKILSSN